MPSWLDSLQQEPPDVQAEVLADLNLPQLLEVEEATRWQPLPGPQTLALETEADVLFYGGAAGGGKTDLAIGLAGTLHRRSIIFRRIYKSLTAIIERSRAVYGLTGHYVEGEWKLPDDRVVWFDSLQHEADKEKHQGQPHDLYVFDELPEFTESQFRFVIGWNRTTVEGQRCRVVATGNPPTDSDGEWVIRYFAPWLDDSHPNPARPGELRWFTTQGGKDVEVARNWRGVDEFGQGIVPKSRTFIPARLIDNPILLRTGYMATLQAMPEPLRSQMLFGDFKAGREDNAFQVVPSAWVEAAMKRWQPKPPGSQDALGVDVARGGKDKTVIAPRHGHWFGPLKRHPGKSTPDSRVTATLVLLERLDDSVANIDVIGVGSGPYDALRDAIADKAVAMNGAEKSIAKDKSGKLGFVNQRAEWWWKMREGLDPASGQDLELPPDPELKADLCAPRWKPTPRGIQIEEKAEIIKRIGRSPDAGDAVVNANAIKIDPGMGVFGWLKDEAAKAEAAKDKEKHPWRK